MARGGTNRSSFRPKGVDPFLPFDFVFFDPPYRMAMKLTRDTAMYQALSRLARETVTSADARLYFRAPEDAALTLPDCWTPVGTHAISSMEIHVFEKRGATS